MNVGVGGEGIVSVPWSLANTEYLLKKVKEKKTSNMKWF